jgi:hypothetical protein
MNTKLLSIIAVAFLFLLPAGALAQTTGSITGTVFDGTGAILQSAAVTITQNETGQVRNELTDDRGRYHAPNLPVGNYELKVAFKGFQPVVHTGIRITIGRNAIVDIIMKVGEMAESMIVNADAKLVDTSSSQVTGLVQTQQIENLPLNGRDFTELVAFQSGVSAPGSSLNRLSISGGRYYQTEYLLDGTDVSRWDGRPSGVLELTLGVDTIREFVVLTNSSSAEYGGSGVSMVSSVTKSGTNQMHGSAYYYIRNSALDAKDFFDSPDEPIPPFRRHQFGGTFGGPINKNRAFYFGSYEGIRQSLGITSTLRVPSENARIGLLGDPKDPSKLKQVIVHPASEVWLEAYPVPNSPRTFGPDIGEAISVNTEPTHEDYFLIKVDYALSESDSFSARYTFDDSAQETPTPSGITGLTGLDDARNQYGGLEHRHIATPNLMNILRFGANRNRMGSAWVIPPLPPEFSFVPGKPLGQISVTGLSSVGVDVYRPHSFISNVFDLNDTATWIRGTHSVRFGGQFKRTQVQTTTDLRFSGQVVFSSLERFLTGLPLRMAGVLPGSSSYRGFRRSYGAFFIQDDWKLNRQFTLNMGLRWELMSTPNEVNDKVSNLRNVTTDTEFTVGDPWFNLHNTLKGLAPRVGFAWDPTGTGSTVLRGGFGVYAEQLRENNYSGARSTPPFVTDIVVPNPPWPDPLSGIVTIPTLSPSIIEFDVKIPVTYQWNVTLQQQLFKDTVITAAYIGSSSFHLGSVGCPNCAVPAIVDGRYYWAAGLPRPNPAFDYIRYMVMDAEANYHGAQLKVEKRFSGGFALQGTFTFSKAIDNGAGQSGSEVGLFTRAIEQDRDADRSLSAFDIRRSLSVNFSYDLPFGPGRSLAKSAQGISRLLVEGWSLNSIVRVMDGSPGTLLLNFNRSRSLQTRDMADRPDLTPGASKNPVLGDPAKYYDPTAFSLQPEGYAGNLGRNTLILPGYASVDTSLVKRFRTKNESTFEFRAEAFNVLNRPNFGSPNLIPFLSNGSYNPAAGVIGSTRGTSRQLQFALRYSF